MQAAELAFLRSCTLAGGAKNYQLWNHRRRVALQLDALNVSEVCHSAQGMHRCRHPWHTLLALTIAKDGLQGDITT